MKFSVRQSSLLDIIQTVSKAVAVRTVKQVLTGILIEVSDDRLIATAYDLELGIQTTLTANEDNDLDITEPGTIVLPARYFSDIIRKLPDHRVALRVEDNFMVAIESGQAQFHLHGVDPLEFPKLPYLERSRSIRMTCGELATLIKSTVFAASPLEVRPILTGVHLTCMDATLTFTATDALRLAKKQCPVQTSEDSDRWTAVLPSKSLNELVKILPDSDEFITMQFTDSHSLFEVEATLFYSRLIEGTYPDTARIIPASYRTEVLFDTSLLLGAIDRASLVARDREVRLGISANGVVITSSSPDIGNLSERIDVMDRQGDDITISFNAKYVLEALRPLQGPTVRVLFNGWNQPFVLREDGDESGLQLISPVLMR